MTDPQTAYLELVARVDDFTRRVTERYPNMLKCERGCDDCCQRDLSLFPIEIEHLVGQLRKLPQEKKSRVLARARRARGDGEVACPFLEEGQCVVYEARPVICRSHGLPLLLPEDGSLSLCPYNFKGVMKIDGKCVLDLSPVNQILATTNLMWAQGQKRSPERNQVSRAIVCALEEGGLP